MPEVANDKEAALALAGFCGDIFEDQLDGWLAEPDCWPKDRSFAQFKRWFGYRFHSMLIDLSGEPLISEESVKSLPYPDWRAGGGRGPTFPLTP